MGATHEPWLRQQIAVDNFRHSILTTVLNLYTARLARETGPSLLLTESSENETSDSDGTGRVRTSRNPSSSSDHVGPSASYPPAPVLNKASKQATQLLPWNGTRASGIQYLRPQEALVATLGTGKLSKRTLSLDCASGLAMGRARKFPSFALPLSPFSRTLLFLHRGMPPSISTIQAFLVTC